MPRECGTVKANAYLTSRFTRFSRNLMRTQRPILPNLPPARIPAGLCPAAANAAARAFSTGEAVMSETQAVATHTPELISAASDLLAACEAVVDHYQSMSGNPNAPIPDRYWITGALMARDAIAKARG